MDNKPTVSASQFPSISSLFTDSWHLFVSRLLRFFLFGLLSFTIGIAFYIVMAIVSAATIFSSLGPLFTHKGYGNVGPQLFSTLSSLIPVASILFIVFFIGLLCVSSLGLAWLILSMSEDKDVSFGAIFKKGFSYVLPLFVVSLLVSLISIGGFFFFVVPVILFSFFFIFAHFEVVNNNQRGVSALKKSYTIVATHFGDIFIRLFLFWLLCFALGMLPQLFRGAGPGVVVDLSFLLFIVECFLGWYAICYTYTLYTQARQLTDVKKSVSLLWVWIVTLLGWIILVVVIMLISAGISQLVASGQLDKILQGLSNSHSVQQSGDSPYPQPQNNFYRPPALPTSAASNPNSTYTYPSTAPQNNSYPNPTIIYQQQQAAQEQIRQMQQDYNNAVASQPPHP